MVEIITRGNANSDQYNYELDSVLLPGNRVRDPDFPLKQDAAIYELLRKDPITSLVIMLRRLLVAGEKVDIMPASDRPVDIEAAKIDEELILGNIENYAKGRFNLAWGVIAGHGLALLVGEMKSLPIGGQMRDWWVPTRLIDIDKRRYDAVLVEGDNGAMKYEHRLWSWVRHQYEIIQHPEWYVSFRYDSTEGQLDRGRGISTDMYFYAYAKRRLWQSALRRAAKLAEGMRIHKLNGLREGSTGKTNLAVLKTAKNNLKKTMSEHDMFIDKEDEIDVMDAKSQASGEILELINLADNGIARVGLGAVLPTGGDSGSGSFARSETEMTTTRMIVSFDRTCLAETLNHINRMTRFYNRENYRALGLGTAAESTQRLSNDDIADPRLNAEIISILSPLGMEFIDSEVREKTGNWSEVTESDRTAGNVLEPAPPPAAGGFGGGLFSRVEDAKRAGLQAVPS